MGASFHFLPVYSHQNAVLSYMPARPTCSFPRKFRGSLLQSPPEPHRSVSFYYLYSRLYGYTVSGLPIISGVY